MSLASPALELAPIGRSREQAILRAQLAALVAGRGGLALIAGEAGIGKTTLVDWLTGEARELGVAVVSGYCYDLVRTPPYGPWRDAFANPSLTGHATHPLRQDAAFPDVGGQEAFFAAVRAFLANLTAAQPLLLVLEDMHWAEPASLDLLRAIARGIEALPLLLVTTYRADELPRQHPLARLLPLVVREARATRIDLQPLAGHELESLVISRYALSRDDTRRLTAYLRERAGGNPFYLTELLRTLEQEHLLQSAGRLWRLEDLSRVPVPRLVQQVIEHRLRALDEPSRRLLDIAAIAGQQVPLAIWQAASGEPEERLLTAMDAAIELNVGRATPQTTGFMFTHALVRDTLYQGLPLPRRRDLHRRVAEALSSRDEPPVTDVASHFAHADDPRSIDWLIRAGEQALTLYAGQDAVAAIDQAHELADRHHRRLPATAFRTRAMAYTLLGDFDRARHDHELVLQRGRAANDQAAAWQALIELGMLWSERDYERTGGHYRAALALARESADTLMIASSLNHIGNWHVNLDEPDLAIPLHQEALALFAEQDARHGMADSFDFLGMAAFLTGDLPASTAYCERAIALYRELDDRRRLASCLGTLTITGGEMWVYAPPTYREAASWLGSGEEALAIARDIGWAAGEAWASFALSAARCVRGDLGRALDDAVASLTIAERIGHVQWTIAATCMSGTVWTELLDPRRAASDLEQSLALARRSGSRYWTNTVAAFLASVLIAKGEIGEAAAILDTVIPAGVASQSSRRWQYLFVQAELDLARHQPDQALAIIDELLAINPDTTLDRGCAQLLKLRGDALRQVSRPDEAAEAYLAARHSAALFGFSPILWRIDLARGKLYRTEGRAVEAETAFQSARTTLAELAGSIPDDALRAGFRQRAAAMLPQGALDDGGAGLSARELDVLRLLVEGHSDREIGEALHISPRTVMRHVTGILNKLGVSSRTAAASQAIRQGLV